jgi:phosphoribosylamine-glycine ligase
MRKYKCLNQNIFEQEAYKIIPLRDEDKYKIMQWRNEQIDILRQKQPLTKIQQEQYFATVVAKLFDEELPNQILFSYLKNDELIGYGGLVHIDWESQNAEISFLTETRRNDDISLFEKDFTIYLKLLEQVAFVELNLNKIYTYAYDLRGYLIEILDSNNYDKEAVLKNHIKINNNFYNVILQTKTKERFIELSQKQNISVLITSSASKFGIVSAVKNAIKKTGYKGKVICADSNANALTKYVSDEFWQMPDLNHLDTKTIIEFCKSKSVKLIIPTRDGELLFWSKLKKDLLNHEISILVSDEVSVKVCLDKLLFFQTLKKNNISAIFTTEKIDEIKTETNVVVKEQFGAGAKKIGLNITKTEAIECAKRLERPIFQPFVEGEEISVDAYVDKQGNIKGIVSRKREVIINGESQVTTTIENKEIETVCMEAIHCLKPYGHVIFQVLLKKDKTIEIIECNSRFGGASTLSIAYGLDSFYWAILEALHIDLINNIFIKNKKNLTQVRIKQDLIFDAK